MRYLRQSTAVDLALGPFLDATDGVTAETGLTISQADVRLKKNAGAWAQKNDANAATHEENGWYETPLNTTDTDTLGVLMIAVHESGALPVWHEFMVVPANVYDSLFSTDKLEVDVAQFGGSNLTSASGIPEVKVASLANNAITAASINADAITAAKLAADVTTELQSGLATAAALTTVGNNVDAILADTGTDGVVVAAASKTGYTLSNTGMDNLLQRALTEAYSTVGGTVTLSQFVYEVLAQLQEFAISGTTLQTKKRDQSTNGPAFTLDDATNPTSLTRAS